jgi:phosphohistidine phosphatase
MIVGHNPAVQILVLRLARGGDGDAADGSELAAVQRKYPTGALAALAFDGEWSELARGDADLVQFVRPKGLAR